MKYPALMCGEATVELTPEERSAIPEKVGAWIEGMDSKGVWLQGHPLAPVAEVTMLDLGTFAD